MVILSLFSENVLAVFGIIGLAASSTVQTAVLRVCLSILPAALKSSFTMRPVPLPRPLPGPLFACLLDVTVWLMAMETVGVASQGTGLLQKNVERNKLVCYSLVELQREVVCLRVV